MTTEEPASSNIPDYPATVRIFRLGVDLFLLGGLVYWGQSLSDGVAGSAIAIAFCIAGSALWILVGVPADPLRDSWPIVRVGGMVRLIIELAILGITAFGVWTAGSRAASETLLTAAGLCYGVTWERSVWFVRHSSDSGMTKSGDAATGSRGKKSSA